MRKHGGFIGIALMLLTVPSLANAWTLYAKVSGNSSDGVVLIQDDRNLNTATTDVLDDYLVPELVDGQYTNVAYQLRGGTTYLQLQGEAQAAVVLNRTGLEASVAINYLPEPSAVYAAPTEPLTFNWDYTLGSADQAFTVAWGQSSGAIGDVNVQKQAGGSVVLQSGSASSMTGFTNLAYGTLIAVKAMPKIDYAVTGIYVDGVLVPGSDAASAAGAVKTVPLTIGAASHSVEASFALVPWIKPVLSAPSRVIRRTPVAVNANGTTSNDSGIQYAFSATGACDMNHDGVVDIETETDAHLQVASSSPIFSFSPICDSPYTLTMSVTTDNGGLVDKTATINVVREYEMTNLLCTGCHTQSTPAVITEYDAGTHSHRACTDCHGDAPHNGDGANGCINCHDGGIVNGWAASAKASGNEHATGREACARCHQPDGEVSADNGFAAVGCRGCHNDEHTFDFSVAVEGCASCHNRDQATGGYHYETATRPAHGPDIVAKVAASKHLISTEEGHGSANCQRCHTLEGYLAFAASGSDFGGPDNGTGFVPVAGATINVSCAACHDPHTGDLRATPGWAIGSAQANVCTSCHNLVDASGTPIAAGLPVGPVGAEVTTLAKQQHGKDWYRNIASTHYDLPTTGVDLLLSDGVTAAPKTIEGYVVRLNADTACTDCHGHELRTNTNRVASATPTDATIHTDWAMSAHAGGLLKAKIAAFAAQGNPYNRNAVNAAAVMTAGVEDAPIGNAWAHYDWDSASRQACQHCHTATGAANFMDAAADEFATYDPTANDFSHLLDGQNELLYCWGCHSSVDSGALRATGAIPLDYTVDGAFPSLTAPDGNSAACLSCHSGRGNADSLLNGRTTATPDAITDYKIGGTSTHYFAAGATIYQVETKVGYTFGLPAASYANPSYFAHNQVGCAECHMTSDNSHSFAVVAKDETTGAITQLLAANCVECHSGAHGAALVNEDGPLGTAAAAAAFLEEEAEGYHQALEVFGAALAAAGTTPDSGYPYFVVTDPIATPTLAEAVQNEGHSGAMHNYSYLHHEPGAYAHNRLYAKRLIYDSLDWLDNAVMDQSVVVDAVAYPHAATWLGATRP